MGEGGSKYMKMVVRETIASPTLENGGGTLQSPTHTSAKLQQQQSTLSPHQKYHQETFKKYPCVLGVSLMLRGSKN